MGFIKVYPYLTGFATQKKRYFFKDVYKNLCFKVVSLYREYQELVTLSNGVYVLYTPANTANYIDYNVWWAQTMLIILCAHHLIAQIINYQNQQLIITGLV